ncbi:lipoate--protein ligase family protein [Aureliella helgolandensis]|uniref:Putative lipoate-protein ligase A n=1 Tax=Aureliella helgolandensis TaxID=2527968 RepID=A0A518G5F6_9BACT|nr:lipoate--protein ligase family protein [Aureliella helgolandensis]QDV23812.1 putative lipoate-protein ligase A [Aureliella helgolandensis]
MQLLRLTMPTPQHDLALDEALLETAERGAGTSEMLRFWQAQTTFIVLGRSGKIDSEIDRSAAERDAVPILRRSSGGGTVVAAPGCLFYSLLLSLNARPHLRMIDHAHQFVMEQLVAALQPIEPQLTFRGTCDLVLGDRKLSGNSLRVRRNYLLYHGTLLLGMDLSLISKYLKHPPREPDYRGGREHHAFVANLNATAEDVQRNLQTQWQATDERSEIPVALVEQLAADKYACDQWTFQR